MLLFEYQGKELLRRAGIPTPKGCHVRSPEDLDTALRDLTWPMMVKAQVLTGGRGKAGGIRPANNKQGAKNVVSSLLGHDLKGHVVRSLLLEEQAAISHEYYLAITFDGDRTLCLIGGKGGVEVENFFSGDHKSFQAVEIDMRRGLSPYQVRRALELLDVAPGKWSRFSEIAVKLAGLFRDSDLTLAEINPLAELSDGSLVALDARIVADDGALFRQTKLGEWAREREQDSAVPLQMKEMKIQYVPIGGSVGIISIGAGVAVAIMDWLKLEGADAAAFVDIDYAIIDGRTRDALAFMVEWFSKDDSVNAILLNFVTCGHRLDEIAQHLVAVLGSGGKSRSKPIVLNLQGNRDERAHAILKDAGFSPSATLGDAVRDVAKLARVGTR